MVKKLKKWKIARFYLTISVFDPRRRMKNEYQ